MHALRESWRVALWKDAAMRRPDMIGLSPLDGNLHRAYLKSLHSTERAVLQEAFAGAVVTAPRRDPAIPSDSWCPHCCVDTPETPEHRWWVCPAWAQIRQRHSLNPSWQTHLPTCYTFCGLWPLSNQPEMAKARIPLWRTIVDIQLAIRALAFQNVTWNEEDCSLPERAKRERFQKMQQFWKTKT